MMLTIVFTVLGQHEMATLAIRHALENCTDPQTRILVVDNGGDYVFPEVNSGVSVLWPGKNIGVYPVFDYVFRNTDADIVAFFHSDLIVVEKGFDVRLLWEFQNRPDVGLIGFVGSDQIDSNGGRGNGTTSNFQGMLYPLDHDKDPKWQGSLAEAHGKRNAEYTNAAVVDGCAMVIRREAWDKIGFRDDFPPHHFYDRLISTQMLEAGYKVGVLGVACDHLGGQTVSKEERYSDMARAWCEERGQPMSEANWDLTIYRQGELIWLREYRDRKHLVPIKV